MHAIGQEKRERERESATERAIDKTAGKKWITHTFSAR